MSRVRRKKFDEVICLGDFVGYGAEPNQVLDVMRTMKGRKLYIRGNHDRVAAGFEDGEGFNHAARHAALWTRERLSAPNRRFLEKLPLGPLLRNGVMICHGTPHDEDEYVFNEQHARLVMEQHDAPIILYGHTHMPVIFEMSPEGRIAGFAIRGDAIVRLDSRMRYLINPGSVGQPRDRNPQSSFMILDRGKLTVQFFRVEYDLEKTQMSILRAGLPRILADRLTHGT